jgi:hypothetical protein
VLNDSTVQQKLFVYLNAAPVPPVEAPAEAVPVGALLV